MAAPALVSETRGDITQAPRWNSELLSDQSALRSRRGHQWQHPHADQPRPWLQEHALPTIESKANGRNQHRVRRFSKNREGRVECHSLQIPAQSPKIKPTHTQRAAYVYIRQSTPGQVEHNRESTARQYALADRACQLGWSKQQVVLIDEDLGLSGSGTDKRSGFDRLTSEVALSHVGIVLGLEVSRLARNNADWYRLLELCGITDTLIGDNDGVYHPALFNDRLLLGLKGTMSEAELHIIRARLDGGIRNKAARGELRRGLPDGFVWGEADGEVLFHPDEDVIGAIRTVFERFAEFGSARRVWLWFRSERLSLPLQHAPAGQPGPIQIGRA